MIEDGETSDPRAEIAARNRHRHLAARERRLTGAVFGMMGYSAFANIVASALSMADLPTESAFGLFLGALYALGAYRVWVKDDTRWWPVAIPAGLSIATLTLAAIGGLYHPIAFLLNVALLVLVPIRRRAVAAVPNNSFKGMPLRGTP